MGFTYFAAVSSSGQFKIKSIFYILTIISCTDLSALFEKIGRTYVEALCLLQNVHTEIANENNFIYQVDDLDQVINLLGNLLTIEKFRSTDKI